MLYVLDTETNGLPTSFYPAFQDYNEWPRLQSIAFKREHETEPTDTVELIVKGDFEIDKTASRIHGITREISDRDGIPVVEALGRLAEVIGEDPCPVLCAYNVDFDKGVMCVPCAFPPFSAISHMLPSLSECYRNDRRDLAETLQSPGVKWVCLMKKAHRALKRRPHHKYLKLCECVAKIDSIREEFPKTFEYHSAKGDVEAAAKVLQFLITLEQSVISN